MIVFYLKSKFTILLISTILLSKTIPTYKHEHNMQKFSSFDTVRLNFLHVAIPFSVPFSIHFIPIEPLLRPVNWHPTFHAPLSGNHFIARLYTLNWFRSSPSNRYSLTFFCPYNRICVIFHLSIKFGDWHIVVNCHFNRHDLILRWIVFIFYFI